MAARCLPACDWPGASLGRAGCHSLPEVFLSWPRSPPWDGWLVHLMLLFQGCWSPSVLELIRALCLSKLCNSRDVNAGPFQGAFALCRSIQHWDNVAESLIATVWSCPKSSCCKYRDDLFLAFFVLFEDFPTWLLVCNCSSTSWRF